MQASEISGRAYNYRLIFSQIGDTVRNELLTAQTKEAVIQAFERTAYQREFESLAALILKVLREPDFPKRDREAQIGFLGDSLAARGELTPRTSRDICQRERLRQERAHHIISYEFKIECSCGFKGFSKDHGCPKCKAKIELGIGSLFSRGLF